MPALEEEEHSLQYCNSLCFPLLQKPMGLVRQVDVGFKLAVGMRTSTFLPAHPGDICRAQIPIDKSIAFGAVCCRQPTSRGVTGTWVYRSNRRRVSVLRASSFEAQRPYFRPFQQLRCVYNDLFRVPHTSAWKWSNVIMTWPKERRILHRF